jgi:hypothetical protein
MARYLVEEETEGQPGVVPVGLEGLAVAKALARQKVQEGLATVIVRDAVTGEVVARFEPLAPEGDGPSLANSVRRMRAANDRLKEALVPPARAKRE